MSTTISSAPSTAAERVRRGVRKSQATRTPPQAVSTRGQQSALTPDPKPKTGPVNKGVSRQSNNRNRRSLMNTLKSRMGFARRANQNRGNASGEVRRRISNNKVVNFRILRETVAQSPLPREHFVMMAKFLQFNKMTRTGMKDFTDSESKVYDSLIRMYNDTARKKYNLNIR